MKKNYQVIYLNGPSSVGKTTLARALQNSLKKPFLLIGIDKIIGMMPPHMNDWETEKNMSGFNWEAVKDNAGNIVSYKLHTGEYGKKIVQMLKDISIMLLRTGHFLIIDDVSFGKKQVYEWRHALQDFDVLWVGVTAPLEIIEERERMRGNRKIGSARWQFEHVHRDVKYDLMVNTYKQTPEENSLIIAQFIT
jgi:chloramphenicol 3-O phosphotransferase